MQYERCDATHKGEPPTSLGNDEFIPGLGDRSQHFDVFAIDFSSNVNSIDDVRSLQLLVTFFLKNRVRPSRLFRKSIQ